MVAGPQPTELPKLLDPDSTIEKERRLFCEHYVRCLDTAVSGNWTSWTCVHCPLFGMECAAEPVEGVEIAV